MTAYRAETEQLTAERLPQVALLFLSFVGGSGVLEYVFYPQHFPWFFVFYFLQVLVCLVLVLRREALRQRQALLRSTIGAWLLVSLLLHGYGVAVGVPAEIGAIAAVYFLMGLSLLL